MYPHDIVFKLNDTEKLVIDFDHSKCLTALLSSSMGTNVKNVFKKELLERTCTKKSIKTLDVLLKTKCFK